MRKTSLIAFAVALFPALVSAQARGGGRGNAAPIGPPVLLVPDRVWNGVDNAPHDGWVVLVRGERIEAVDARANVQVPSDATTINLPGTTLIPGLIEGHSHLLLHPYNETSWNDQVLTESLALRVARATNHAKATLLAGFTTVRDLGTEGAAYADVELKQAVNQGIVPGPRILASTRAIVATGSYQPKTFVLQWTIPQGARLGQYQAALETSDQSFGGMEVTGEFRVEEYRVPLMKGSILYSSAPLVSPSEVTVDLNASYLAGGTAGRLPIKLRHQLEQRYVQPADGFPEFVFSNGGVKEGLFRSGEDEDQGQEERKRFELKSASLTLDRSGSVRTTIPDLPKVDKPVEILTELEFRDPNGEVQTVASRIPLWPSHWLVGIKPDSWTLSKESLKFQVAVTDLKGGAVPGAAVNVDLYERKTYSHRKRLVGGFYAYEHSYEVKKIQTLCQGKTNQKGLLLCEAASPVSGNVILQASVQDLSGLETKVHQDVWIAGKNQQWFRASDDDRMDVLPEKRRYEMGEMARFQVRMPFAEATALITIEREGVGETLVKELSGKEPVIEIPVKGSFAPNVYVSVLAVRGRVSGVQPTATVDLGRPAYKLGITEIAVGWRAHELKVNISPERQSYKVREKARVSIVVKTAEGKAPGPGSEVAVAAVDEGLLELLPNRSWQLLEAMMNRRRYGVQTATAQTHVIGKRHFGLKALPSGGGGGKQIGPPIGGALRCCAPR
jgi:hypothetical protein